MTRAFAFLAFLMLSTAGFAQTNPHAGHGAAKPAPAAATAPSTREFIAAHDRMMRDMNIPYTGDADIDFVRGMIPHHQAAIDAAEIVLKYGKNPENQVLAKAIIAAQKKEIAEMQAWLAKYAK
jgi:uncharacterized protein (DUF305 family)